MKFISTVILCMIASTSMAQGLVEFSAGTQAKAAEVNSNFSLLETATIDNATAAQNALTAAEANLDAIYTIDVFHVDAVDSVVAVAFCPAGSVAVAAAGDCMGDPNDWGVTTNLGVLIGIGAAIDGAATACWLDALTYDPTLADPVAFATATCVEVTDGNGNVSAAATKAVASQMKASGEVTEDAALLGERYRDQIAVRRLAIK